MVAAVKLICAASAGIASHVFVFIYGEWHLKAAAVVYFYLALFTVGITLETLYNSDGYASGGQQGLSLVIAYLTFLYASVVVYRAFFHPLRRFPGPPIAGITKFWHTFKTLSSRNHILLDSLYHRYGTFVRTGMCAQCDWHDYPPKLIHILLGPNELTIYTQEAFAAMDGPGNACSKAVWYDFLVPEIAVNTTRDKASHDRRRRIWDRGFSTSGIFYAQDHI